jgi:hypothetical protein
VLLEKESLTECEVRICSLLHEKKAMKINKTIIRNLSFIKYRNKCITKTLKE